MEARLHKFQAIKPQMGYSQPLEWCSWVRLRVPEVKRLLQDYGLKKWWVAEFTGVHKTTFRRWLSGAIRRVHHDRALCLAQLLGVRISQIAEPWSDA